MPYKIYTKTGDKGEACLYNMTRKPKVDIHFQALGDIDELNASLGVVRLHCAKRCSQLSARICEVQSRLIDLGSHVATPRTSSTEEQCNRTLFDGKNTELLEKWIDEYEELLPPLRNFIIPSGGPASTHLHVARTVCRRAERRLVDLLAIGDIDPAASGYINRLSDFLFVAGRYVSLRLNEPETMYQKDKGSTTTMLSSSAPSSSASSSLLSSWQSPLRLFILGSLFGLVASAVTRTRS